MTQMSVHLFMPLSLQLLSKQADVGSSLIRLLPLLLWYVVTAIIDAIGMSCRSLRLISMQEQLLKPLRYEELKLACKHTKHTCTG